MASEQYDQWATGSRLAAAGQEKEEKSEQSANAPKTVAEKKAAVAKDRAGDELQQAGGAVKESLEGAQNTSTLGNR